MNNIFKDKKVAFLGFDNLTVVLANLFNKIGFNFDIISNQIKLESIELKEIISLDRIIPNYDYYILTDYFFKNIDYYHIFCTEPYLRNRLILQETLISMMFNDVKTVAVIGNNIEYTLYHFLNVFFLQKNYQLFSNFIEKDIEIDLNRSKVVFLVLNKVKVNFIKSIQLNYMFLLNTNDYLDVDEIEEYFLKKQNVDCVTVLNVDDIKVKKIFDNYNDVKYNIKVKIPISAKKLLENGFSLVDNIFYNYYDNNNSHYDLLKGKELITTYNINISILSCLLLMFNIFNDVNEILSLIDWQRCSIKDYFQLLGYKNNIAFISNLVNVNFEGFKEQLNSFLRSYCICIVHNNCDILYEEEIKNNHSIFLIIDENSFVKETKLSIKNYKIFSRIGDCFGLLRDQLHKFSSGEDIAVILTTTDYVEYNEINSIFTEYIKQFTDFISEIEI